MTTVLIAAGAVAELDKADFGGIPTSVDQGGRPGAKVQNNAAKVHSCWREACFYCHGKIYAYTCSGTACRDHGRHST